MKTKTLYIIIASLIAVIAVQWWLLSRRNNEPSVVVTTDTVTVVKVDTITRIEPRYITKTNLKTDTLYYRDTIAVPIPITQKFYSDSFYNAWISGYNPKLDSISIFNVKTTTYVNKTETFKLEPKMSLYLNAGGYAYNKVFIPSVDVGIVLKQGLSIGVSTAYMNGGFIFGGKIGYVWRFY